MFDNRINPYDYYRTARDFGGAGRVSSLGTAARATGEAINSTAPWVASGLKTTGRIAGVVAPVAMGALDYFDGKAQGEGEARAVTSAVGSGLGGWGGAAGGATLGTMILPGVGTVAGGIIGGLLGSKVGNEAVDAGWKVLTDDDGLQVGSDAYKQHYAGLYRQAKAAYNANPTPENKAVVERSYANATGTTVSAPTSSAEATSLLDRYRELTKELDANYGPHSTNHLAYRQQAKDDSLWDEQQGYRIKDHELKNQMTAAAFDHRNTMAVNSQNSYWNDRDSSRNYLASLWR